MLSIVWRIWGLRLRMLRKGVEIILSRDLCKVKNKTVLEVGCGDWPYAKNILEKGGNCWGGLDMVKGVAQLKGSVGCIPFWDDTFDLVLCTQCFEHFFEYGISFKKALGEIHRVLKPNGLLMLNTCVQNHGHPLLVNGDLKAVKELFAKEDWDIKLFEKVIPKQRIKGWKRLSNKGVFSKVGYPTSMISNPKIGSYILNIHAKKRPWLNKKKKTKRRSIALIGLRFLKEMIK